MQTLNESIPELIAHHMKAHHADKLSYQLLVQSDNFIRTRDKA